MTRLSSETLSSEIIEIQNLNVTFENFLLSARTRSEQSKTNTKKIEESVLNIGLEQFFKDVEKHVKNIHAKTYEIS